MGKKESITAVIHVTVKLAFNLPDDCEDRNISIGWKRGSKSQNKGETKPAECIRGRAVFGDELKLQCTFLQDLKKKTFDSKMLELELKEEGKKKPLAKSSFDLGPYASAGNYESVSVPLSFGKKKKKEGSGGPAVKISLATTWTHIGKKKLVKSQGNNDRSSVMVDGEAYDLQTETDMSEDPSTMGDSEFSETDSEDDEDSGESFLRGTSSSRGKKRGDGSFVEKERKEKEKADRERKEKEKADRERKEKEKADRERKARERRDKEKREREKKRAREQRSKAKDKSSSKKPASKRDSTPSTRQDVPPADPLLHTAQDQSKGASSTAPSTAASAATSHTNGAGDDGDDGDRKTKKRHSLKKANASTGQPPEDSAASLPSSMVEEDNSSSTTGPSSMVGGNKADAPKKSSRRTSTSKHSSSSGKRGHNRNNDKSASAGVVGKEDTADVDVVVLGGGGGEDGHEDGDGDGNDVRVEAASSSTQDNKTSLGGAEARRKSSSSSRRKRKKSSRNDGKSSMASSPELRSALMDREDGNEDGDGDVDGGDGEHTTTRTRTSSLLGQAESHTSASAERLTRPNRAIGPSGRRKPTRHPRDKSKSSSSSSKSKKNDALEDADRPPARDAPQPSSTMDGSGGGGGGGGGDAAGEGAGEGDAVVDGDVVASEEEPKASNSRTKRSSTSSSKRSHSSWGSNKSSATKKKSSGSSSTRGAIISSSTPPARRSSPTSSSSATTGEKSLRTQLATRDERLAELESELSATRQQKDSAIATRASLEARVSHLKAQVEEAKTACDAREVQIDQLTQELRVEQEQHSTTRASVAELGTLLESARLANQQRVEEHKQEVERLHASLAAQEATHQSMRADVLDAQAKASAAQDQCHRAKAELSDALEAKQSALEQLSDAREECASLEALLSVQSRKASVLSAQLEDALDVVAKASEDALHKANNSSGAREEAEDGSSSSSGGAAAEAAALRLEALEARKLQRTAESALADAAEERATLTNNLKVLRNQLTQLEARQATMLTEAEELNQKLTRTQSQRSAMEETLEASRAHNEELRASCDTYRAKLSDAREQRIALEAALAAAKSSNVALVAERSSSSSSMRDAERRGREALAQAQAQLAEAKSTLAATQEEVKHLKTQLDEAEMRISIPSNSSSSSTTTMMGAAARENSAEDGLKDKITARRRLQDLDQLKSRIRTLESAASHQSFFAEHIYCARLWEWDSISTSARALVTRLSTYIGDEEDDEDDGVVDEESSEFVHMLVDSLKQAFASCPMESQHLMGWTSFLCCIHDLLENDVGTVEDEDRGDIPSNGIHIPQEDEEVEDDILTEFFDALESLLYEVYVALVENLTKMLGDEMVPGLFSKDASEFIGPITSIYQCSTTYHLFPSVRMQLFGQLFAYLNAMAVNALLEDASLCTCGSGFTIKLKISEIEEYFAEHDKSMLPLARHHLTHAREMATILVVDKSICSDEEAMRSVFTALSLFHIRRVLEHYHPDELSPEPVSPDVLDFLENLTDQLSTPDSIALDEKDILPLNRDFMK